MRALNTKEKLIGQGAEVGRPDLGARSLRHWQVQGGTS
jgi:hypothetical protein